MCAPLTLPPPAPPIQVMLGKARPWTGGQLLILLGGGFASEEEARAAGISVKTAVLLGFPEESEKFFALILPSRLPERP
jgi:hypothetical protein